MAEKPGTDEPRTLSGKRPSATSLQSEREYIDWLSTRAIPEREGMHDDSWAAFMAKRRGRMEKLRLPRLSEWQKERRHRCSVGCTTSTRRRKNGMSGVTESVRGC